MTGAGDIAISVSVKDNRLIVDLGKAVDWISLDRAHLTAFIAVLMEKGKELR